MLPWATELGGRYMGAEQAEQFGRRNAVPGELLVRLVPDRIVALPESRSSAAQASPRRATAGGRVPRIEATMSSTRRVARTSCARNTWAPCHADSAVAARVPSSRSAGGRSSVSPMKSLRDRATSTGHPVATSSSRRRVSSSECQVFLPKSCVGSTRIPSRRTPRATAASAAVVTVATTSATTSS